MTSQRRKTDPARCARKGDRWSTAAKSPRGRCAVHTRHRGKVRRSNTCPWRQPARAGLRDSDGTLLRPTPHDFRRLYLTELVANKLPVHIAAQLAGHRSLNTTQGYVAIYPQDVFNHYDQFLERRRATRPSHEYRQPTADELQVFADHFGRRRVELGDCVRPYGSGCTHEHACIRCNFCTSTPTPPPDWTTSNRTSSNVSKRPAHSNGWPT